MSRNILDILLNKYQSGGTISVFPQITHKKIERFVPKFEPHQVGVKTELPEIDFEKLRGIGNTNDVDAVIGTARKLNNELQSMDEVDLASNRGKQVIQQLQYFTSPEVITRLQNLKDNLDKTEATMKTEESVGEYAVDSGQVLTRDVSGTLNWIDMTTAFSNPDRFKLVTNGEYFNALREDPSLGINPFRQAQTGTAKADQYGKITNNVGTRSVRKELDEFKKNLGSTAFKQEYGFSEILGNVTNTSDHLTTVFNNYIRDINQGRGTERNAQQIGRALESAQTFLSQPARNRLLAQSYDRASREGLTGKALEQRAQQWMNVTLAQHLGASEILKEQRKDVSDINMGATKAGFGTPKEQMTEMGDWERNINGIGNEVSSNTMLKGTNILISSKATQASAYNPTNKIKTESGRDIDVPTRMLDNDSLAQIMRQGSQQGQMSIAGTAITDDIYKNLNDPLNPARYVLKPNSQMIITPLIVKTEGGVSVPVTDPQEMKRLQTVQNRLDQLKTYLNEQTFANPTEKELVYKDYARQLEQQLRQYGNYQIETKGAFVVYVDNDINGQAKLAPSQDQARKTYDQATTEVFEELGLSSRDPWGPSDNDVYEAVVTVPISHDTARTLDGKKPIVNKDIYNIGEWLPGERPQRQNALDTDVEFQNRSNIVGSEYFD